MAAVSLAAFVQGYVVEGSLERGRTYAFSTLVVAECLRALVARSQTRLVLETGLGTNLRLLGAVALVLGLQLWSHHSSALGGFLKTGPLELGPCLALLALGAVPATVLEVSKLVRRRRRAALVAGSEVVR